MRTSRAGHLHAKPYLHLPPLGGPGKVEMASRSLGSGLSLNIHTLRHVIGPSEPNTHSVEGTSLRLGQK